MNSHPDDLIRRGDAMQIARNRRSHARGETARACRGIEVSISMLSAAEVPLHAKPSTYVLSKEFTEFERAKGNGQYETMVPLSEVEEEFTRLQEILTAEKLLANALADDLKAAYLYDADSEADEPPSLVAHRKARGL